MRRVWGAAAEVAVLHAYGNGLGTVRHKPPHDVPGELEHACLGLLAVRGVGGVSKVVEVLVRELRNQGPQHADAADPESNTPTNPLTLAHLPKMRKRDSPHFSLHH